MNNFNPLATPVTYGLIILCIICFVPVASDAFPGQNPWALFLPENEQFRSWQYLSSMFMHGNWMHLLLNMFGLWMFGSKLERHWSSMRFLLFYLACGLGGGLIYTWVNSYQFNGLLQQFAQLGLRPVQLELMLLEGRYPVMAGLTETMVSNYYGLYHDSAVGASGAVYGILAAYALCFPNQKLVFIFMPYPIAAKYFVPALLSIDLFFGLTDLPMFGMDIAHFAHIGGAITGFILALILGRQRR